MGATMAFGPPARSGEAPFGCSKQESRDIAGGPNADVPKGCCQKARQRQPSPQSPPASGRGGDRPFPRPRGKVGMGVGAPWHRRPGYDSRRAPSCRAFWQQRIPRYLLRQLLSRFRYHRNANAWWSWFVVPACSRPTNCLQSGNGLGAQATAFRQNSRD